MLTSGGLGGRVLKEIFILYGSQTGNSEYIAKDVYKQCLDRDIRCQCASLNSVKGLDLKELALGIVVVCSTTGNGDCPENADNWWRAVKLRKVVKDMFQAIPYAVLGLGDTNYDKFCYMGKMIDKRLSELGATHLMDLVCADEAVGLEDVVEDWKAKVVPLVVELYKSEMRKEAQLEDVLSESDISDVKEGSGSPVNDFDLGLESERSSPIDSSNGNSRCDRNSTASRQKILRQQTMLEGVMDPSQVCNWLNIEYLFQEKPPLTLSPRAPRCETQPCRFTLTSANEAGSPTTSQTPKPGGSLSRSSSEDALPISRNNSRSANSAPISRSNSQDKVGQDISSENPFVTNVVSARWLTTKHGKNETWGESKRVVEMKVAVNENIGYNPGDALGFICPNPPIAVTIVYDRLAEYYNKPSHSNSGLVTPFTMATCIKDLCNQTVMTLEEFLVWKLDLTGPLKKSSLFQLAKYCTNPLDTTFIEWLCNRSNEGQLLWQQFVESQKIGIAEFLALVPSCCPPLSALVTASNTMVPRYYSAASSPLVDSLTCTVAFSIHRYQCGLTVPNARTNQEPPKICRFGLATSYFEQLLEPWLYPKSFASQVAIQVSPPTTGQLKIKTVQDRIDQISGKKTLDVEKEVVPPPNPPPILPSSSCEVRVFLKPTASFRLPGSSAIPLLLIGPGTGVAPFIGFLDHRMQLEKLRVQSACGISTGVWRGFDLDDLPSESVFRLNASTGREKSKNLLFFGCRAPHDYIYKDRLEEHLSIGTLASLDVAFSRLTEHKEYVTHRLLQRSEEIASLILEQNCCVYICGDGNHMAKDVFNTIKTILMNSAFCNGSEAKAVEVIEDMKQRRRYLLDIWG